MKTAVEQLMIDSFGEDFRMKVNDYQLNAFQKALEKEKEQIIEARENGLMDGINAYVLTEWGKDSKLLTSEQYYNQTYKN